MIDLDEPLLAGNLREMAQNILRQRWELPSWEEPDSELEGGSWRSLHGDQPAWMGRKAGDVFTASDWPAETRQCSAHLGS
jgi:hypothetical protein